MASITPISDLTIIPEQSHRMLAMIARQARELIGDVRRLPPTAKLSPIGAASSRPVTILIFLSWAPRPLWEEHLDGAIGASRRFEPSFNPLSVKSIGKIDNPARSF